MTNPINSRTVAGLGLLCVSLVGSWAVNRTSFQLDPEVYAETGDLYGAWVSPDVRGPVNLASWLGLVTGTALIAWGTHRSPAHALVPVSAAGGIDMGVFGDLVPQDSGVDSDWAVDIEGEEPPDDFNEPETATVGAPLARVSVAPSRLQARRDRATGDWVKRETLAREPSGDLVINHYHACGVTGSGKTTLVDAMIGYLTESWGISPIVALINPKHVASNPEWRFQPICTDIDDVLIALAEQYEAIKSRLSDPEFDVKNSPPLFVIVDEWDWIYEQFKDAAVSTLRKIFKTGRSVKVHLFLCGQSPLASDTGLSGSDYKNMGRFILNSEAIAFLNNRQFPYDKSVKAPLYSLAVKHQEAGRRFCLFIGIKGLPEIREVPNLTPSVHVEALEDTGPVLEQSDPWEETVNA